MKFDKGERSWLVSGLCGMEEIKLIQLTNVLKHEQTMKMSLTVTGEMNF